MPRILSIANAKGGVGKSTVTILLAAALAKQKKQKVLILDTDSQQSVSNWLKTESMDYDTEALVTVAQESPQHVRLFLDKYGEDYDTIFIDIPRMTNSMNETANVQLLYYCDSVLIPVLGSRLDVMSTQAFYKIIKDAKDKRDELGFDFQNFGFVNRETNLKDNQEAKDLLADVLKIPMLSTALRDLKIFKTPSLFQSVLDTAEGKRRFEPFFKEVCKKLKL